MIEVRRVGVGNVTQATIGLAKLMLVTHTDV